MPVRIGDWETYGQSECAVRDRRTTSPAAVTRQSHSGFGAGLPTASSGSTCVRRRSPDRAGRPTVGLPVAPYGLRSTKAQPPRSAGLQLTSTGRRSNGPPALLDLLRTGG